MSEVLSPLCVILGSVGGQGESDKMPLSLSDSDALIERPGLLLLYTNHELGSSYEILLSVLG